MLRPKNGTKLLRGTTQITANSSRSLEAFNAGFTLRFSAQLLRVATDSFLKAFTDRFLSIKNVYRIIPSFAFYIYIYYNTVFSVCQGFLTSFVRLGRSSAAPQVRRKAPAGGKKILRKQNHCCAPSPCIRSPHRMP